AVSDPHRVGPAPCQICICQTCIYQNCTCRTCAVSDLGEDLGGQQLQVVEVVHVEDLEVDALGAQLAEPADLVDQLAGRARQPVLAQLRHVPADGVGAAPQLGLVPAAADDLRGRADRRLGPAGFGAGRAD